MKYKTTNRDIKAGFSDVLKVGYCNLQNLLAYESPEAYTCGRDGWHADFYNIGGGVCISTGYAPTGSAVPYELQRDFDKRAEAIRYGRDYEATRAALDDLIREFRAAALVAIGKEAR